MSLTAFPGGILTPLLVGPAGMSVVPANGNVFFVDGTNGSDSYDGRAPGVAGGASGPFKTLDVAYNACTGGLNEIVYVLGSSSSVNLSSAIASGGAGLVWSKNMTHLIGLGQPGRIGQRSHISNGASTNLYTPLITVSGKGCLFQNIELFNGGAHATQAAVCLAATGVQNAFVNCQISGGGHATAAGNAAMRSLLIGGTVGGTGTTAADENYFGHCYIGLDTIVRTTTSSELEILNGSARVTFEDCIFSTYTSAGTNFIGTIGANGIDRFCLMKNCEFMNASTFSGGIAVANAFSLNAAPGGVILLHNPLFIGFTATAATKTALFFDNAYATTTTGKGVVAGW
jgi:hypothetical protein